MTLSSSRWAYQYFKPLFTYDTEEVWIVALTSGLNPAACSLLFRGTVDSCMVHPRDIVRFICVHNASSFILAHNHPSGLLHPSEADIKFTRKIIELSQLIQIPLHDHLILSTVDYFSFADHDLLKKQGRVRFTGPLYLEDL